MLRARHSEKGAVAMRQGKNFHSRVVVWHRRPAGKAGGGWMLAAVFAAVFLGTSFLLPQLPGFDEALSLAAPGGVSESAPAETSSAPSESPQKRGFGVFRPARKIAAENLGVRCICLTFV